MALGQVRVLYVPSTAQFADIFTKGLPSTLFCNIRSSLNVLEPPVDTAGGMLDYYLALKLSSPSRIVIGMVSL